MKLRHGSYRKLPLLTWAVIVIGCVVVLPGAGLITAQEPDEKLASPKPVREDDCKVEAQPLPFMDGPFGKFQRSQQALIKQGQADKKQKLQVQTTIYALPQTPSVRFADVWSTFRNWDENETGLAQGLRDSTKRMSLVYNNPVRYRVIDSESDQQVLRSVNGVNFESKEVIQSTLMTGESTRVQQSDKAKFLVAMLKVDGRPDEDRHVYRHFETGFDLGLQISVTNDGGYSMYSSFYFHDVENPTPAEQKQILGDSDFIPPKPSVVTKIVTCKVDFARNEKVALLVRDVKQKPYLAIIECEPESNPKSESATAHASDESKLTKRPKHKATDGLFVFTCNGDDPDDLEGSRTINYFGDELTVTKSVMIEKSNGWTTLRGKQIRWLKKGQELISADSGVFKISEDGTSFEIALQGNARSWRDETTLHEADRIVSTWSDVAASDKLQGNAKVTNSRPLYENEDYQFPDVSADCIRFELSGSSNDVVCSGNVTVVQKSTSSEPMVTRAEKVRLVPETEIRGLSTKVKIQVIDP